MGVYSSLWPLMSRCLITRPSVPTVLITYSLYWTSFIREQLGICFEHIAFEIDFIVFKRVCNFCLFICFFVVVAVVVLYLAFLALFFVFVCCCFFHIHLRIHISEAVIWRTESVWTMTLGILKVMCDSKTISGYKPIWHHNVSRNLCTPVWFCYQRDPLCFRKIISNLFCYSCKTTLLKIINDRKDALDNKTVVGTMLVH